MDGVDYRRMSYFELLTKLNELGSPWDPRVGASRFKLVHKLKRLLENKSKKENLEQLSRYSSADEDSDAGPNEQHIFSKLFPSKPQTFPENQVNRNFVVKKPVFTYSHVPADERSAFSWRRSSSDKVGGFSKNQLNHGDIDKKSKGLGTDWGSYSFSGWRWNPIGTRRNILKTVPVSRSSHVSHDNSARKAVHTPARSLGFRRPEAGGSTQKADSVVEREHLNVNGRLPSNRTSVDLSKEFKTMEEKVWISLHNEKISMILIGIALVFFLALALMYMNVRLKETDLFGSQKTGNSYPICSRKPAPETLCIPKGNFKAAFWALGVLRRKLDASAANAYCDNRTTMNGPICIIICEEQAVNYLVEQLYLEPSVAKQYFRDIKVLLLTNPSSAVGVIDCSTEEVSDSVDHLKHLVEHGGLTLLKPVIPVACQLKQLALRLKDGIFFLITITVAVIGLLFGVWRYKSYHEEYKKNVFYMVNKIIFNIKSHHEKIPPLGAVYQKYVPVDQCREEIVPPALATTGLLKAWKDAEKFIDQKESRIISSLKEVDGKIVKVWQWSTDVNDTSSRTVSPYDGCGARHPAIKDGPELLEITPSCQNDNYSDSSSNKKLRRSKMWQGQAFDTMAGCPNSLPCSPTPCLKIRHMFDPTLEHGEDWPSLIKEAILEKCGDINITHMYVDCNSPEGCVFVKCSDHKEAGKAYRALHGWWFDSKLVTVKYLRISRYHERFPEAAKAASCL